MAQLLASQAKLPPLEEQRRWEEERIKKRGDGAKFRLTFPDFEEYFNSVRELAGLGEKGLGRKLLVFMREWFRAFLQGHERRNNMWWRANEGEGAGETVIM